MKSYGKDKGIIVSFRADPISKKYFLYVSGATCIRRLLAVLVGLQSEIIGEREILMQVARSVKDSFDAGCINDTIFNDLQKLIFVSEQIRQNCAVNSNENYSTIAADIFVDHLSGRHDITIAIVGGGYMADKFFSSLLKTNSLKIKKILWINRGTSQLKDRVAEFVHLLNYDIEVLDLETGRVALKEADAIFCALSKSPYFYNSEDYKNGSFVVDVSYPQVFSEKKDVSIVTISNTDFYSLVRETVSKSNIALANNAIDDVINFLGDNI